MISTSTKVITLETAASKKLAERKPGGESVTETIERLIEADSKHGACEEAVREAAAIWKVVPCKGKVEKMEQVTERNRKSGRWDAKTPL